VSLRMSYLLSIVGNMQTIVDNQSLPGSAAGGPEASPSLPRPNGRLIGTARSHRLVAIRPATVRSNIGLNAGVLEPTARLASPLLELAEGKWSA
jgi:hypothetical protein